METAQVRVEVCDSRDLPDRGRLVVDIGDKTVGVFRLAGELYAYLNSCPHLGGPVCQGLLIAGVRERLGEHQESLGQYFDEDDLHIVCPWHGFEYSVQTGRHAGTGSPELISVPVTETDGVIYVEL